MAYSWFVKPFCFRDEILSDFEVALDVLDKVVRRGLLIVKEFAVESLED